SEEYERYFFSVWREYMAASEAAMEAIWIRKFVGDLGVMPSIKESLLICIVIISPMILEL
ncbi:hypothetical protein Tco_0288686, partial [Tanacetum coccineum]